MSETTEPTLAERLLRWPDATTEMELAEDEVSLTEAEQWSHDRRYGYVRGYDDARAECAAEIAALRARVEELESLALDEHSRLAQEEARPAAVGVVGSVRWGLVSLPKTLVAFTFSERDEAQERATALGDGYRVVAIVDPDAMVPLQSTEPEVWLNDDDGFQYTYRHSAADNSKTTVTPLYLGQPQEVR